MKILIDIIQDRKKFIENDLCTFMYDIYSDIYKLEYSTSHRKRDIVTIVCKTDTKHFHRRKYNILDITNKDIYEIVTATTKKIKQIHIENSIGGFCKKYGI